MLQVLPLLLCFFCYSFLDEVSAYRRTWKPFCTIGGAGRLISYFNTNWRTRIWSLVFVIGIIIGGFISFNYLMQSQSINLNPVTVQDLSALGFMEAGNKYLPPEIFDTNNLLSLKGIGILVVAGLFIGFWDSLCWWMYLWSCHYRIK